MDGQTEGASRKRNLQQRAIAFSVAVDSREASEAKITQMDGRKKGRKDIAFQAKPD